MTETPSKAPRKAASKSAGLSSMLLADLKSMAGGLGIAGAGSMKKAQLVDAIKAAQSGGGAPASAPASAQAPEQAPEQAPATGDQPAAAATGGDETARAEEPAPQTTVRTRTRKQRQVERAEQSDQGKQSDQGEQSEPSGQTDRAEQAPSARQDRQQQGQRNDRKSEQRAEQKDEPQKAEQKADRNEPKQGQQKQAKQNQQQNQDKQSQQNQQNQGQQQNQQQNQAQHPDDDEDGEGGSRRNRRRRGRDRERPVVRSGGRNEPDTTILEDDVLVPAAGILDVLDNCAFVRTSGYLPGPEDVYLSLSMVRKYHLRRGDAVVGQVRQPREGERREKFNPMVRIDSVNGTEADGAKERPHFADAVPVHPHQRLRLATDDANLIGRVIDIAAPVGKGQRGLVLTPPRTGATTLLQSVAQSVTANNPECHVMVVLVDTRPEEVTDFQRAVKGEVVASTFDRQPADHTLVAELAIERAKRLVELGHDVVVLLDSLTRLGRAYNLAAPANGRVLGGVVDASAVHPTKEFFGAARTIEDGGSLTILATVTVGTGSATDEFFLEELAGTANSELVLSAEKAAKGIVPAVDVAASGTRHEEKLLAPAEGAVVGDLRKQLAAADSQQAVVKVVGRR
ncbi:Transcription termination factor rho [metagenome]|uniref:Transcription termination factor rho n=1 Tax=metagenome TaxID=256318 RepID=A0A2P2CHK1_9ZZZZ